MQSRPRYWRGMLCNNWYAILDMPDICTSRTLGGSRGYAYLQRPRMSPVAMRLQKEHCSPSHYVEQHSSCAWGPESTQTSSCHSRTIPASAACVGYISARSIVDPCRNPARGSVSPLQHGATTQQQYPAYRVGYTWDTRSSTSIEEGS